MNEGGIIALIICSVMPLVTLYRCAQVRGIQAEIEERTLLRRAMDRMDESQPLEMPACYDVTQIISLKTKGLEIRRRYNIRYNLCQSLRLHLNEMSECGYVSQYMYEKIKKRIEEIENENENLKKQFNTITTYLEEQHAHNVAHRHAESADRTLRELERQNEELLRHTPLPEGN